ncbi:MAG TPA: glycoside hydrolase family 172 protein [Mucilaginibacter sp.]|jgi:hypothetical protein
MIKTTKKTSICFYICFLAFTSFVCAQDKKVNLQTELKRLYDVEQLPRYISGSNEWEKSSYDTTGGNDDGFSGRYSFVRRNPDSTLVIFEAKGKGVINRIWMPTRNDDTLDFYFDGKEKPAFSIKFNDLFSDKVFPFIHPLCGNQLGGYYCYLPMPFNNGCKIVLRAKQMQFYQIQCRSYPDDYSVKTFDPQLSANEKNDLKKIAALWEAGNKTVTDFYKGKVEVANTNATIKPGETLNLLKLNSGGRIVGIEISPASAFAGVNKLLDLKVTWDNEINPAIYAPLADFFGYAFGNPSMQSLLLGTEKDKNYCYFPMPFDKKARIDLIYRVPDNDIPAPDKTIQVKVYYSPVKRDPVNEGKFYTNWFNDIKPPIGKPHVFLDTKGKGHYVGTILQAQGLYAGMTQFFEGDDSTSTDGVTRIHGTGSEDYFNGGWYALMDRWDTKMSLPLHGALDYSLPFARTGGYRLYLDDKISFNNHISHSIEHGPQGNKVPVVYTSMALYYSADPANKITPPINRLSRSYVLDTLIMYPQLMKFGFWGITGVKEDYSGFNFIADDDGRINISLATIPPGRYKLYADVEINPKGADISFWQRQTQVSGWLSLNSPKKENKKQMYVCDLTVDEFKNSISIVFKTNGENNELMLSRLIFAKE